MLTLIKCYFRWVFVY